MTTDLLSLADVARLGRVQAAGLLRDLTPTRSAALAASHPIQRGPDSLPDLIVAHLSDREHDDHALHAPLALRELTDLGLGLDWTGVLADDPDDRHVHLLAGPDAGTYRPRTFDAWVAVFNAALAAAGDPRRFVALHGPPPDEARYLLVTPPQHQVLADERLESELAELALPPDVPLAARAAELAQQLPHARADGDRVRLELDLAAGRRLVADIHAQRHPAALADDGELLEVHPRAWAGRGVPDLRIVVADLPADATIAALESTPAAIVVRTRSARLAFARGTGVRVDLPASPTPLRPPPDLDLDARSPGPRASTGTHLVTLPRVDDRLGLEVVDARGEIAGITLPGWITDGRRFTLSSDATARVVLLATTHHLAWLPFETIAAFHTSPPGSLEIRPAHAPGAPASVEVRVARVNAGPGVGALPANSLVIERDGVARRAIVCSPHAARISEGQILTLRPVAGTHAVHDADDVEVARDDKLAWFYPPAPTTSAPHHPVVRESSWRALGPRTLVARHLSAEARARLERLRELLPSLTDAAIARAAADMLARAHVVPQNPASLAGMVLAFHLRDARLPPERALVDDRRDEPPPGDAARMRAARANAELAAAGDPRRFVGFRTVLFGDAALCLSPDERARVEREHLLALEAIPEPAPEPADLVALVDVLADQLGVPAADLGARQTRGRLELTLAPPTAAALRRALRGY